MKTRLGNWGLQLTLILAILPDLKVLGLLSSEATNLEVEIVVVADEPVLNRASLNLNSSLGGYIVWVST